MLLGKFIWAGKGGTGQTDGVLVRDVRTGCWDDKRGEGRRREENERGKRESKSREGKQRGEAERRRGEEEPMTTSYHASKQRRDQTYHTRKGAITTIPRRGFKTA